MSGLSGAELEARIAELEAENAALRADTGANGGGGPGSTDVVAPVAVPRERRRWGRTAAAIVLVVVGLLLAPVAVISAWARLELVDTERFVATFAPLAEEPAVQDYISAQTTAAIEEQVDIPGLTKDVFDGIKSLDLPPRAEDALTLLEAPAAQGLQSLVAQVVDRVVTSEAFADVWAAALRATHTQFVAAVQGDPDAALAVGGDGTISVQLGPIIETVKERLEERGVGFAAAIPEVDRSIVIAQDDAFALIRTIYTLAVAVGTWLPWIVLLLLTAGVLVAKRRSNALVWTAGGFALTMVTLAAGIGIGRTFFIGTVSPSIMPSDTAEVVYDGLLELMLSTILALFVLAVLIALIAWFSGPSRPARAVRGLAASGFSSVRRSAASHGVTTGAFGVWLDRWRGLVYAAIAVVASVVVLLSRPVTTGTVVTTVLLALLAVLLVELLRRPEADIVVVAVDADDTLEGPDVEVSTPPVSARPAG
jgi:hypothetical protein